jgi:hypothetical protein
VHGQPVPGGPVECVQDRAVSDAAVAVQRGHPVRREQWVGEGTAVRARADRGGESRGVAVDDDGGAAAGVSSGMTAGIGEVAVTATTTGRRPAGADRPGPGRAGTGM